MSPVSPGDPFSRRSRPVVFLLGTTMCGTTRSQCPPGPAPPLPPSLLYFAASPPKNPHFIKFSTWKLLGGINVLNLGAVISILKILVAQSTRAEKMLFGAKNPIICWFFPQITLIPSHFWLWDTRATGQTPSSSASSTQGGHFYHPKSPHSSNNTNYQILPCFPP